MEITEKNGRKVKTHIVYKNKAGEKLPSVTQIISILAKPALIHWAWDLGCKGIDYKTFRDDKADIGTLAHEMILCHLKKKTPDTSFYSQNQIDLAETCFLKYLDWEKGKSIEPILLEEPRISEAFQYGGTIDNYCLLNGVYTLIDYKTSKAIYDEYFMQVTAYNWLLIEYGFLADDILILRIGRDETEGFEVRKIDNPNKYFEIFKACLSIYNLKKEIKEVCLNE
jgi:hypothetical protein